MAQEQTRLLIEAYRRCAAATGGVNAVEANRAHDEMHRAYKVLRSTDAGRQAILTLIRDPSPNVRCWAAAHSLAWAEFEARQALEELVASDGRCAFTARMTLREFDAGRLSSEY